MNNYVFSPSTNAFYPYAIKQAYEASHSWPEDGVEVSDDVYNEYSGLPPNGKTRGVMNGMPAWVDIVFTQEQIIESAIAKKKYLISEANTLTQPWQTQLLLGIISDADKASLTTWMKYYQQVQAVDTSKASDINWPEKPS